MIETKVAFVNLVEEDLIRIEYKPDAYVDIEAFAENLDAYKKLMTNGRVYFLTVVGEGATITQEARDLFATPERSSFKIAEAFVIKTMAHRIVANFVMKVQRPKHIMRVFSEEIEAMTWLKSVMKNAQ
jgi:hypothetical protein